MFDSSKDILFIVIAVSVAVLTFLFAWLLIYMIRIFRRAYGAVNMISEKIEMLARLVDTLKEKIEHSATAVTVLSQTIGKVAEYWTKRRSKKTKTTTDDEF